MDLSEVREAKYLDPVSSAIGPKVMNLDIKQLVERYGTVIDTGDHENVIDWIMRPALPYMFQKVIVRQPREEKPLCEDINSRGDYVKEVYTIIPSSVHYNSRWNPMDEILEGVRDAAAQDPLFGDRAVFDDESFVQWWFYTNTEFFKEAALILLCALKRASLRPYVHNREYLGQRWRTFTTAVDLVSGAMSRCIAADYYFGPLAGPLTTCIEDDESDSPLRIPGVATFPKPHDKASAKGK